MTAKANDTIIMGKKEENQRAYDNRRAKVGKPAPRRQREPSSNLQPVKPVMSIRSKWTDTPEDRAEVAQILNRIRES
jgi:hypothetical protein